MNNAGPFPFLAPISCGYQYKEVWQEWADLMLSRFICWIINFSSLKGFEVHWWTKHNAITSITSRISNMSVIDPSQLGHSPHWIPSHIVSNIHPFANLRSDVIKFSACQTSFCVWNHLTKLLFSLSNYSCLFGRCHLCPFYLSFTVQPW